MTTLRQDGRPGKRSSAASKLASSVLFASGMAGIAAIFDQLPTGAVVALPDDCYQGVAGLATTGGSRGRWTVHRVAVANTARWIEMCGVADLIWLESPSNPLLTVADLNLIAGTSTARASRLARVWPGTATGNRAHRIDALLYCETIAFGLKPTSSDIGTSPLSGLFSVPASRPFSASRKIQRSARTDPLQSTILAFRSMKRRAPEL